MKPLTTYQISQMIHVDISTIIDWIDKKMLSAYKTPGGHRRVKWNDLVKFLKKYKMPISDVVANSNKKVWVNSVKSQIPLAGQSHKIATNQQVGSRNDSRKILIVDDDENILQFISVAIKKLFKNIKIETATDGFTTCQKIAEFKPDLLILDIKMPGMDGFAVLEHLKKEKMKIIAITAYPSKEIREKIIEAGADDFLIKPFSVEELKQKTENLLIIVGKKEGLGYGKEIVGSGSSRNVGLGNGI